MDNSRWNAWSGVLFVVLLVAGTVVINLYEYLPDPGDLQELLEDNSTRVSVGAYLGGLSAFMLMWWSGALGARLREAESGSRQYSAVAMAGGIVAAAMVIVSFSAILAAAQRAGTSAGISPEGAVTTYDISTNLFSIGFGVSFGLMMLATTVVASRSSLLPNWLIWTGSLAAIGLLTPLAWVFLVFTLVWVIAISYYLMTPAESTSE